MGFVGKVEQINLFEDFGDVARGPQERLGNHRGKLEFACEGFVVDLYFHCEVLIRGEITVFCRRVDLDFEGLEDLSVVVDR